MCVDFIYWEIGAIQKENVNMNVVGLPHSWRQTEQWLSADKSIIGLENCQ